MSDRKEWLMSPIFLHCIRIDFANCTVISGKVMLEWVGGVKVNKINKKWTETLTVDKQTIKVYIS